MAQVNAISQLSMDDIASSGVKKVRTSDSNFSDIMSESARSNQDEQKSTRAFEKSSANSRYDENKNSVKKIEQTDDCKKKNVSKSANIDSTDAMQEVSKSIDAMQEALKSVDAFKEKVAETLGISKEELEEIMAESGLITMDLLNVNTLKDLVLQVNGLSDPSELLTNESVCNQLADLLQTVDEFVQITDMEQFAQAALAEQVEDFATILDDVDVDGVSTVEQADVNTEEPMITVQREVASDNEESDAKNDSHSDSQNVESQFNQFVQNLSNSTQGVDGTSASHFERLQQMQEIVDQVVENIKVTLSGDSTSMEIQLNPEHLGKVNLSVIAKHGQLTASFVVENHMAREALESQLSVLKENLNEQGIKVEAIEVTVAEQGFSQNDFMNQGQGNFQNQTKRSNHVNRMRKESDLTEEVEEEAVSINQGNGTVDFSA